ncbi:MAG: hypothetical protein FWG38_06495 [Defluviitaleaceae bacterium]|nr:hypothetical protein [Defluviitaleaceae bacterium]
MPETYSVKMIMDIPQYGEWQNIETLEGGWSMQHKFKVTDKNGQAYLLRLA